MAHDHPVKFPGRQAAGVIPGLQVGIEDGLVNFKGGKRQKLCQPGAETEMIHPNQNISQVQGDGREVESFCWAHSNPNQTDSEADLLIIQKF
jgi:hypothetical protein